MPIKSSTTPLGFIRGPAPDLWHCKRSGFVQQPYRTIRPIAMVGIARPGQGSLGAERLDPLERIERDIDLRAGIDAERLADIQLGGLIASPSRSTTLPSRSGNL